MHFTSPDLVVWKRRGVVPLSSDFVIDAAVAKCPDWSLSPLVQGVIEGNGRHGVATSTDGDRTGVEGVAIPGERMRASAMRARTVFMLGGFYWMIVDEWRGQAVFRSPDCKSWTRQGIILDQPGADPEDKEIARHADVVVQDGWPHWSISRIPTPA